MQISIWRSTRECSSSISRVTQRLFQSLYATQSLPTNAHILGSAGSLDSQSQPPPLWALQSGIILASSSYFSTSSTAYSSRPLASSDDFTSSNKRDENLSVRPLRRLFPKPSPQTDPENYEHEDSEPSIEHLRKPRQKPIRLRMEQRIEEIKAAFVNHQKHLETDEGEEAHGGMTSEQASQALQDLVRSSLALLDGIHCYECVHTLYLLKHPSPPRKKHTLTCPPDIGTVPKPIQLTPSETHMLDLLLERAHMKLSRYEGGQVADLMYWVTQLGYNSAVVDVFTNELCRNNFRKLDTMSPTHVQFALAALQLRYFPDVSNLPTIPVAPRTKSSQSTQLLPRDEPPVQPGSCGEGGSLQVAKTSAIEQHVQGPRLPFNPEQLIHRLGHIAMMQAQNMRCNSLAHIIITLGKFRYYNPKFLSSIAFRIRSGPGKFGSYVPDLLLTFDAAKHCYPAAWETAGKFIANEIAKLPLKKSLQITTAYANQQMHADALFSNFLGSIIGQIHVLQPTELATVLWNYARVCQYVDDPSQWALIDSRVARTAKLLSSSEIARVLWAYAVMRKLSSTHGAGALLGLIAGKGVEAFDDEALALLHMAQIEMQRISGGKLTLPDSFQGPCKQATASITHSSSPDLTPFTVITPSAASFAAATQQLLTAVPNIASTLTHAPSPDGNFTVPLTVLTADNRKLALDFLASEATTRDSSATRLGAAVLRMRCVARQYDVYAEVDGREWALLLQQPTSVQRDFVMSALGLNKAASGSVSSGGGGVEQESA